MNAPQKKRIFELNDNDQLDEYKILRFIKQGQGKFARVYKANPQSAIKLFTVDKKEGRFSLAFDKFKKEAEIIQKLSAVKGVINSKSTYRGQAVLNKEQVEAHYYAMELMDGDLETLIIGDLDLKTRIDTLLQIAATIDECHDAGIYHRDLYTPNILIKQETGGIICKLTDFGSAKVKGQKQKISYFMPTGHPNYSSPEASVGLLGGDDADGELFRKSDAYAFGLLMYEVLTGYKQENLCRALASIPGLASSQGLLTKGASHTKRQEFIDKHIVPIIEAVEMKEITDNDIVTTEETVRILNELMKKLLVTGHDMRNCDFKEVKKTLDEVNKKL